MTKTRHIAVWIAVIAVCCFLLGLLADRYVFTGNPGAEPSYLERLADELDLTREQKERVALILNKEDERIKTVLDGYSAEITEQIQAARDDARKEIRDLLAEPQLEAFDAGGYFSDFSN